MEKQLHGRGGHLIVRNLGGQEYPVSECKESMGNAAVASNSHTEGRLEGVATPSTGFPERVPGGPQFRVVLFDLCPVARRIRRDVDQPRRGTKPRELRFQVDDLVNARVFLDVGQRRNHRRTVSQVCGKERDGGQVRRGKGEFAHETRSDSGGWPLELDYGRAKVCSA
jgi:hypothetical protein